MLSTDNVFQLINYTQFVESFFWGVSVAGLLYLRYKEPNRERPIKVNIRYLSRFFDCLAHPNLSKCNFGHWSKMTIKLSSYLLPKFIRVPFTIVLISGISTMVNGTLLNFGKRYNDNLRIIFDQWLKLHLGLYALSNQKYWKLSSEHVTHQLELFQSRVLKLTFLT